MNIIRAICVSMILFHMENWEFLQQDDLQKLEEWVVDKTIWQQKLRNKISHNRKYQVHSITQNKKKCAVEWKVNFCFHKQ